MPGSISGTEASRLPRVSGICGVMRNENAGVIPLVLESLDNGVETAIKFFSEVDEARRSRAAS